MATILRKDKDNLRTLRGENNRYSPQYPHPSPRWRIPHRGDAGGKKPSVALSALWYPGKENVNAEVVRRIREGLSEEEFEKLRASSMPAWMARAIDQYGREPTGSGTKNRV